jgi:hypothetical protein
MDATLESALKVTACRPSDTYTTMTDWFSRVFDAISEDAQAPDGIHQRSRTLATHAVNGASFVLCLEVVMISNR